MSKKEHRARRRETLLKMFLHQSEDHYEAIHLNGSVYVKKWDGNCRQWGVAVYTDESYAKMNAYKESAQLDREMMDRIARD